METRKKVLVVIPYFPPNAGGGAEKYAYNISRRLTREFDWDVVIATSVNKKSNDSPRRTNGLKIYRLPYKFKLSNSPLSITWFWKIRKIIRSEKPDIINIHAPVPGIGDVAAAMCGKTPLVVNYHMGTMKKHKSVLNSVIWVYEHIILRSMLRKAASIISSSDFVRNEFLVSYRYKTRTITPAVDSGFFHPPIQPVTKPKIQYVGAISRGDKHKGLDILLRSCKTLKEEFPDLHLTVVGGGDGVDFFRRMAADLGLDQSVTFTGRLEGVPWAESYRKAKIYAHPSSNDSFPLVITEAMATGLPVVSTTVGGIPTLVDDGETGLLVPPRDEPAFTAALKRLLSDDELSQKLGAAGRRKAVSKLSWSAQARKTNEIFRSILGEKAMQSKTKIAIISPYYNAVYGHISDYIKQSAAFYKNLPQFDTFVITRHRWSRQFQIKVDDDITIYKLPAFFWFPFGFISPFRSRKIRKIFNLERPDIVQLHIPAPNMASACLSAARQLPIILTYHARGMIHKKFVSGSAIKIYDNIFRERLFKDAHAVIIPSPVILHKGLQKYRFKTHVIIPRIKPSIFSKKISHKFSLYSGRRSKEAQKTVSAVTQENKSSTIAVSGLSSSGKKHIWDAHMSQNLKLIKSVLSHKPNIVQLSAYYPPHLGGVEVVTQEISNELANRGNRVQVITSNIGSKHNDSQFQDTNLIVDKLGSFEFAHTPFMPKLFWRLCKVNKPAIFHLHLSQIFLPEVMWTVAKFRKIPYVIHFHLDVDPSGPLGFLFVLYKKLFWPVLMRGASHVIALSPEQVKMVRERYGLDENKVSYIPNGVSNKFLKIGERSRTYHKPLRLFYLGRLDKQKHFDRMIEALALIKSNVRLDIVGDGEERAKLENLAEQLKLTNVTFHGPKTGDDRLQYYKQADVFVLPSDKEGMPLVMFEAMASGLPVIGSDVQGIREHLKNVGILVPNPSPATFAQAIDKFYDDREKLYPQLSKASKEKAAQYSWPLLTNRIEALYRKIPLDNVQPRKISVGLLAGITLWWVAFLLLRANPSVPEFVVNAVGFSFLAFVPGALTVIAMPLKQLSAVAKICLSIGFSVLELILLGLLGNTVLQWFGVTRPLDTQYLTVEISILIAALLLIARKYGVRNEISMLQSMRKMFPTRIDRFVALFPLIFIAMSVLGAISLNNGGTNSITMAMLISMALFSIFLAIRSKKLSDASVVTAIFSLSVALLFMTSLRGWFTTGHDVQVEYQVFELAKTSGVWQIQLLRVPYNACLSITILPTVIANQLKTLDPYVFKIYFQILFAVCPVIVYLIARNWLSKGLAFIATLYFIAFPTFFTDMPYLNRQEIAFLFLALMLYTMFLDKLSLGLRRTIFLLFGTGLVVSHYSTTYAVILIFCIAFFLWFPIRLVGKWLGRFKLFAKSAVQSVKSTTREKRRISLSMIIILAAFSFIWTSVLTQTGNNTVLVVRETIQAMQAGLSGQKLKSNDTNYSLSSFAATSPELELQEYVKNYINPHRVQFIKNYYPSSSYDAYDISAVHEKLLPLTSIGKFVKSHGVDVNSINTAMRQGSAKLLQIFVLFGFLFVIFKRKHVRIMCSDFVALSYGSAIFVALQVFLPVLSVEYGLLRAFQQSLMVLGIFTVLGSIALFSWLPTRILKIGIPVLLAVFFFLSNTGVITQSLGGYLAQLNLNNSGTYYDIYYTHEEEIAGIKWLNLEAGSWHNGIYSQNAPTQFDDQYTYGKLVTYTNLVNESDIYPGIVIKNAYVYLGYDNVRDKQATISYNGDLVTYRYPLQFLDNHKDLIYANGGAAVYR